MYSESPFSPRCHAGNRFTASSLCGWLLGGTVTRKVIERWLVFKPNAFWMCHTQVYHLASPYHVVVSFFEAWRGEITFVPTPTRVLSVTSLRSCVKVEVDVLSGFPSLISPHGLCGRKATLNRLELETPVPHRAQVFEEDKVKVEVDVLGGFQSRPQLETPGSHRAL